MSQIPSVAPIDPALQSRTANQFSELSSEDFIRIMFTELSNQDPFQPNDSAALLEQLNSIRSIESDLQLMEQLKSLVTENQLASASSMLGRLITGKTADFGRVTGEVVSVAREGETISLALKDGSIVPFSSIETVHQVPDPETAPPG